MKIKEINQHNNFSILVIISLLLCDVFSYAISYKLVLNILNVPAIIDQPLLIAIGIIFLFRFFGRYNPSSLQSRLEEFKIIFILTTSSTFIYLVYKIMFKYIDAQQSQNIVLLSILFLFLDLFIRLIIRSIQKQLLKKNIGLRSTIVIGSFNTAKNFIEKISLYKYSGFKVLGYFHTDDNKEIGQYIEKLNNESLKDCKFFELNELYNFLNNNFINEVIIALDSKESSNIIEIISNLRNLDVCIKVVPGMYDLLTGYAQMHSVTGMPLIDINPNILTELQVFVKRIIDILVSFIGLIIMFPILLITSLFIKITSNGPIIFKQERIGLNGKSFIVHKFRTMHIDSEKDTGPVWAKKNDPRITNIGKILRKTRLDEFPQLFDVLIGNMSIVGPRPERDFFINQLKDKFPFYMRRLNVRPGITGWAQVMGSYDTDLDNVEHKLKLDFYYIENISIWLDIKIMIITIWVILSGKGQ
ncbi:MAG: hypothetical protein CBD26_03005 [Candidatus Pelagibacter sp. TMED166]|nr:MAG: hypothetical protein CBD26_03005 [Candidatus Pelagibacter sp. TMED166]|tara:strand:+ start:30477 stop:31892 length:1416 start_codon:yes stop_codon:yes gene_type:complete